MRSGKLGIAAWALFDWANSPFTTLIVTFVFPAYFAAAIVGDEAAGQAWWGYAMAASGLVVAVLGPILGSVADTAGRKKPWLAGFAALCMLGSWALWYAEPTPAALAWAMAWVVAANVGFEFSGIFYNALLPDLAGRERIGRISGWGWALGYAGGLAALALALVAFVQAETPPFGLDKEAAEHVRVVGPMVALWFALFALPLLAFTPDRCKAASLDPLAALAALRRLGGTLRGLSRFDTLARFLLAHMLYADALATIFAFGGVYAAGVFGMTIAEIITFGIVLNVTAGIGAFCFGWVDDRLGSARTVRIALVGLLVTGLGVLLAPDRTWFWASGSLLGIFVGPAQAASRSLLAHLAPPGRQAELFGLLALSGKATAFLGPALVAAVTAATGSQRWGLATVLVFLSAGLVLMRGITTSFEGPDRNKRTP